MVCSCPNSAVGMTSGFGMLRWNLRGAGLRLSHTRSIRAVQKLLLKPEPRSCTAVAAMCLRLCVAILDAAGPGGG